MVGKSLGQVHIDRKQESLDSNRIFQFLISCSVMYSRKRTLFTPWSASDTNALGLAGRTQGSDQVNTGQVSPVRGGGRGKGLERGHHLEFEVLRTR